MKMKIILHVTLLATVGVLLINLPLVGLRERPHVRAEVEACIAGQLDAETVSIRPRALTLLLRFEEAAHARCQSSTSTAVLALLGVALFAVIGLVSGVQKRKRVTEHHAGG